VPNASERGGGVRHFFFSLISNWKLLLAQRMRKRSRCRKVWVQVEEMPA
jgi:hypothetical protein